MYFDRKLPPSRDSVVWRYMDLAKYLSLIRRSELYFTRRSGLEALDPWEGFLGSSSHLSADERNFLGEWQRRPYINCWHVGSGESAAMWEVYKGRGFGVAVRSEWKRLGDSLDGEDVSVWGELVRYVDYDEDGPEWENVYNPLFYKRKAFEFEHEARLIVQSVDDDAPEGRGIHVDIPTLIESVVVSPFEPAWVADLIAEVTADLWPDVRVAASKLLEPPPAG